MSAAHLVDASNLVDTSKFIGALTLCLSAMISLEMPFLNVFSKVNLLRSYGKLPFRLSYFTDVGELEHVLLAEEIKKGDSPFLKKYETISLAPLIVFFFACVFVLCLLD